MSNYVLSNGKIYPIERIVNGYVHCGDFLKTKIPIENVTYAESYHKRISTLGAKVTCKCFKDKLLLHESYIESSDGRSCRNCGDFFNYKCKQCDSINLRYEWYGITLIINCLDCEKSKEIERQSKIVNKPTIKGSLIKTDLGYTIDGIPCPKCGILKIHQQHFFGSGKFSNKVRCVCGQNLAISSAIARKIAYQDKPYKSWIDCSNCGGVHSITECYSVEKHLLNLESWEIFVVLCKGEEIKVDINQDDINFWKDF